MAKTYNQLEKQNNAAQVTLVSIADCLKGINKDELTVAEKKIVDILIKLNIVEYSHAFDTVTLK